MTVEQNLADAYHMDDPVLQLQALMRVAHQVDELRRSVARLKGLAALRCTAAGMTQREVADAADVTPMMVQQWVKRGRDEVAITP